MFSLSHTSGYAILALGCMRHYRRGWVQVKDIAKCTSIPQPYLQKVLHSLGKGGLIRTKRGYRGGFALSRPANQISLANIAEAVEGRKWMSKCMLGLDDSDCYRLCVTKKFWQRESARIVAELDRLTVANVTQYASKMGAKMHVCECQGGDDDAAPAARTARAPAGHSAKASRTVKKKTTPRT